MAELVWGGLGDKRYETGLSELVLYPYNNGYNTGVAWNGATSFSENPSGAESNKYYADDDVYANVLSKEEWGGTLEAYNSPDEFDACDGKKTLVDGVTIGQQERQTFGLSYKNVVGTDANSAAGEIYHLCYGLKASPSERQHQTQNDNIELDNPSWEISSVPVACTGNKNVSTLEVKSIGSDPDTFKVFKAIIHGAPDFSTEKTYALGDLVNYGEGTDKKIYKCSTAVTSAGAWQTSSWTVVNQKAGPYLPLPDEVKTLFTPAG